MLPQTVTLPDGQQVIVITNPNETEEINSVSTEINNVVEDEVKEVANNESLKIQQLPVRTSTNKIGKYLLLNFY